MCFQPPSVSSINRILRTRAAERAAKELAMILNAQSQTNSIPSMPSNSTINSDSQHFLTENHKNVTSQLNPISESNSIINFLATSLLFGNSTHNLFQTFPELPITNNFSFAGNL